MNKWSAIQENCEAELVPTENVIEKFRAVKTPEELYNLRAACEISSRGV